MTDTERLEWLFSKNGPFYENDNCWEWGLIEGYTPLKHVDFRLAIDKAAKESEVTLRDGVTSNK